jgi:NAD(P)-dependent dehydrogenase (short-subunit alcohol dehydrogenase family)
VAAQLTRTPRFENRTCLVTGGGRGIGRAVAIALAQEGAGVGIMARTRAECVAVQDEIGEDVAVALTADVTDGPSVEQAVAALTDRFGPPSIVVGAAGISPVRQRAEAHDPAAFAEIVSVNLVGAYLVARAAAPALFETRGSVVNVASVLGGTASPRLAAYGASKAGLMQLTRTLAREWADRGVRVNAVCPAYVETQLTSELLAVDHIRREILAETPLGRLGTLEEVVAPILFLLSDEASYITGVSLFVDGGTAA